MSKKIFVGGLPYSIKSSDLEEMFSKFGTVISADVIMDKFTNQSKGFGFVEMDKAVEADKAIESLNGSELEGRKIGVNEARPREEGPRFSNGRNSRGYQRESRNRRGRN